MHVDNLPFLTKLSIIEQCRLKGTVLALLHLEELQLNKCELNEVTLQAEQEPSQCTFMPSSIQHDLFPILAQDVIRFPVLCFPYPLTPLSHSHSDQDRAHQHVHY